MQPPTPPGPLKVDIADPGASVAYIDAMADLVDRHTGVVEDCGALLKAYQAGRVPRENLVKALGKLREDVRALSIAANEIRHPDHLSYAHDEFMMAFRDAGEAFGFLEAYFVREFQGHWVRANDRFMSAQARIDSAVARLTGPSGASA